MEGSWINDSPRNASLAYPIGENIFIVACVDRNNLKMIKIRVTGETTFDWIEAKHQRVTANCNAQETFTTECFVGSPAKEHQYNVALVAKQVETKQKNRDMGKN